MSASFIRTFFAIDLPLEYKRQLWVAEEGLKRQLKKALKEDDPFRWVKLQNFHVTLQFLGQVNEEEAAKLLQHVLLELEGIKAFYLHLGPLEWFPHADRPQVLSLKAEPEESLTELAFALGRGAAALNYPVENRPFRGHLTLARVEERPPLDPGLLPSFLWPVLPAIFVKEVVFFRSDSSSGGSVYTRLASLGLKI